MLNQERIPIGRIRQAYRLNTQEANVLIAELTSRGCVDLYELWHEAVRFVAIEENNKKSIYDEVADPYFPDTSDMGQGLLEGRILTKRLLRHFLYSARSGTPRERLQRIFDRVLYFTYDGPDEQQIASANRILDMIYEQRHFGFLGQGKVDIIAGAYVSPKLFAEFCNFFDDALSANKEAAILQLSKQGYSWERNAKGLSKELVEHFLAMAAAREQETENASPKDTSFAPQSTLETPPEQASTATASPFTVFVDVTPEDSAVIPPVSIPVDIAPVSSSPAQPDTPFENKEEHLNPAPQNQVLPLFHFKRELLNKTLEAVYEILRAEKVHDRVITRVLYSRCGVTTQLQLSTILGTYSRKIKAYLAETESMTIIDL